MKHALVWEPALGVPPSSVQHLRLNTDLSQEVVGTAYSSGSWGLVQPWSRAGEYVPDGTLVSAKEMCELALKERVMELAMAFGMIDGDGK